MSNKTYLAVDFGAGSGRVIAAHFDGNRLELEEVHRFSNGPVTTPSGMFWTFLHAYREAEDGLRKARARFGGAMVSAGVDAWGLDYAHFSDRGEMLGAPRCYRDPRTDGMIERVWKIVSRRELYERTGIQTMRLNTLDQVYSEKVNHSTVLAASRRLLFIPDIVNYFLTGEMANERTIASTSQLYNATSRDWDRDIIRRLDLPDALFGPIVDPGVQLGSADIDGTPLRIVTVGSHDTASAVAATPLRDSATDAYASSGTWSLIGRELPGPILTPEAETANFTNETGIEDTYRFLKNRTGMWPLQECKRQWDLRREEPWSYEELLDDALRAKPFQALFDPDHPDLLEPADMPERIASVVSESGQTCDRNPGPMTRAILESLALKYRVTLDEMEQGSGTPVERLHIVGGGSQNGPLSQFIANAIERPVICGPVEATAIGNVLMQMKADGVVHSLSEGRDLVRASFETRTYEPLDPSEWNEAFERFKSLLSET